MNYIIVDFEWNQPLSEKATILEPVRFEAEIIEIGAVKLNEKLEIIDEFQSFVKPHFYPVMNGGVSRLTKIRIQTLEKAPVFSEVYRDFSSWCGDDYCFCTWGSNDIPAMLDNMLMHQLAAPYTVYWYDLQNIFGHEIMRDGRRWSLTAAVDVLNLPKERAHDALNDARNTCTICTRVDLLSHCDYYGNCYVNYEQDRLRGLISGRRYSSADAALQDSDMISMLCPYCGEQVLMSGWAQQPKQVILGYGRCGEGDEFLARYQKKGCGEGDTLVSRMVYTMSDCLWDDYQDALDQEIDAAV
ncbi:MAG: exonuclease domain-containing protein [Anaerolineaceae bacterium]|nr:exonuclease domain-containing protein [Anaerolineaceae bacterium]